VDTDRVACLPDRCPHRGAKLSLGIVKQGCIECPYHGMTFSGQGECLRIPFDTQGSSLAKASRAKSFPARQAHGLIWVWFGEERQSYPDIPWFPDFPSDESSLYLRSFTWNAHFTRVTENMLDLHHGPFAHSKVSHDMSGGIEDYSAKFRDGTIRTNARLSRKKKAKGYFFELSCHFPNVFLGRTGMKRIYGLMTATPIDEHSTWIVHGHFVDVPYIGKLCSHVLIALEQRLLAPDDRRIVESVTPSVGSLRNQIPGEPDTGITLWYREYERHHSLQPQ